MKVMRIEKKATLISTSVAFLLVSIKLFVGVVSGSVAVLASAIDSLLDMIVSLFNYFALHNAEKEPDENFNFGRRKLEPMAAVIEGVIISFSAMVIFYEAVSKIRKNAPVEHLDISIVVMVISFCITAGLVVFLNHVANKTGNMVIRADSLHYRSDLLTNAAVLLALSVISFTDFGLIDPLLGMAISGYMIYCAYPIIKEGILMLLDAALLGDDVAKIIHFLNQQEDINGHHGLRTRQSGTEIYISVHVVFSIHTSLFSAHLVGDRIEVGLKSIFPDNIVHALIHLDPYDDSQTDNLD